MPLRWRFVVFACSLVAAGAHGVAGEADDVPGKQKRAVRATARVVGRVMKSQHWPANGRIVHLRGHAPTTIKGSRFALDRVPAIYDLWVGLEGEAQVTAYRGLTRRDPVLKHNPSFVTALDEHSRKAEISGILRGDFPFPVEKGYLLNFSFLSTRTTSFWQMGYFSEIHGPRFGRMRAVWNDVPSVAGLLVVLGRHVDKEKNVDDAYLASQPVVLTDKAEATMELTLTPIPMGHLAGDIKVPEVRSWNGQLVFRLSGNRGEIGLGCALKAGKYDCTVPDLSSLGGDYCIHIIDGRSDGSEAKHCGGKIGATDFSFAPAPPPQMRSLEKPGVADRKTVLSWSGERRAVYAVDIRPADFTGGKWVEFRLYTAGTRLAWKDLKGYGFETPPGRSYAVSVSRMIPYRSVDDIASAAGPWPTMVEYQRATSNPLELKVAEKP